jgi:hypothetical protein
MCNMCNILLEKLYYRNVGGFSRNVKIFEKTPTKLGDLTVVCYHNLT